MQPKIAKFFKNKIAHFWSLRPFKVIEVDTIKSTSSVLIMISNMSVPICNRFHDKQANNDKKHF